MEIHFLSGIETISGNYFRQTITTGFHPAVFKLVKTSEKKLGFSGKKPSGNQGKAAQFSLKDTK
jgi:hypothetical protein